jgi:hypothetical protein
VWLFFPEDADQFLHPDRVDESRFTKASRALKSKLSKRRVEELVRWAPSGFGDEPLVSPRATVPHALADVGVAPRSKLDEVDLHTLIDSVDWIVGAVNFDEDLHFSSFYTRQSCQKWLPDELKRFGYSTLVAVYEDFNEIYYLPKSECVRVAEDLLELIRETPLWLQDVIDRIYRLADDLVRVFPYEEDRVSFPNLTDAELLSLYRLHNEKHRALYQWARIPEALDRGVSTFTSYQELRTSHKNGLK